MKLYRAEFICKPCHGAHEVVKRLFIAAKTPEQAHETAADEYVKTDGTSGTIISKSRRSK